MYFCGININVKTREELFKQSTSYMHIITLNAEGIVKANSDARLLRIFNNGYVTIDGQIPLWLYKIKYPKEVIYKLSGSDIIYDFCNMAEKKSYKVFLLGGKELSNKLSLIRLREKYPQLNIDGYSPPFEIYPFSDENETKIRSCLLKYKPDIIFVGFGMGKQEYWIEDNSDFMKKIGVKWVIGSGGTFEFVSQEIKRAPLFIQKVGLESIWRLITEPKLFRFKRIIVSLGIFKYCFK